MGATIVVGGQYGSEGKGKVVALTAALHKEPWVVRCGGPNSGHTVTIGGEEIVLRQIPAGAGHPNAVLLLSAGCAIDENLLLKEVYRLSLLRDRIIVDPRAVIVEDGDRHAEKEAAEQVGSTASGTGAALMRRMTRSQDVRLAKHSELLRSHVRVEPVAPLLHAHLDRHGTVIVEGTQGFGLSLLHGQHYPYVTARDTTAAAFISEVGLSPLQVSQILMVLRTFPIRVGGNSGPIEHEIAWKEVQGISEAPEVLPEYTSVTKRLRRVAMFDLAAVKTACLYNRPTALAVMGIDRLDYRNHCISDSSELTQRALAFLNDLARETALPITWVGTGFDTRDVITFSPAPISIQRAGALA
jgi:adenylosuccinate synthase